MARYRTGIDYRELAPTTPPTSYGSWVVIVTTTGELYRWNGTSWIGTGPAYKVYSAQVVQTGSNAPVATVLANTLGGTPVWARVELGEFACTLEGAFTANKTLCFVSISDDEQIETSYAFGRISNDVCYLTTNELDDTIPTTQTFSVEIRVYP